MYRAIVFGHHNYAAFGGLLQAFLLACEQMLACWINMNKYHAWRYLAMLESI